MEQQAPHPEDTRYPELKPLTLVGPAPDVCQVCGHGHEPPSPQPGTPPHNPQSLYWKIAFHREHGRYPTWEDALAHTGDDVHTAWREALANYGIVVETRKRLPG